MKLRMNEDSVRLRLRRSEVDQFRKTGSVSAAMRFPNGRALTYRLAASGIGEITVSFVEDVLEVLVPAGEGEVWSGGNAVGMYGSSCGIEILVEKDFRRTSMPSPDDADRYPNPRATAAIDRH